MTWTLQYFGLLLFGFDFDLQIYFYDLSNSLYNGLAFAYFLFYYAYYEKLRGHLKHWLAWGAVTARAPIWIMTSFVSEHNSGSQGVYEA